MSLIKAILFAIILPITLLKDVFTSQRSVIRKIGYVLLVLIVFWWIWWMGVSDFIRFFQITSYEAGVSDKLTKVSIRGTSMMPGIKDGDEVELKSPKKYGLVRGDVVSFINEETRGSHYIKRIVGLPGEEVFIKNGNVFINGKALKEDYTLNNLPTFGNTALIDCENYTIPDNHFAVFGDNRTVSSDSRVLGFIHKDDIDGVIKANHQEEFLDEAKQLEISKVEIDSQEFLKKLNEARKDREIQALVTHTQLNQLAGKRAEEIKEKFDDWKNESIPVDKSLDQNGYRFNQVHEFVTFGYLSEEEIINQILDSELESDHFFANGYTEVGIGVAEKTNKECTFPVISIILSWPAVPTYDKAVLDSWVREMDINRQSLTNLQTWVGDPRVDQTKLKSLIAKIAEMQQIATRVHTKEKNREWLTQKDYQDIKRYDEMIKEVEALDKEIFRVIDNVQGVSIRKEDLRRF